MNSTLKPNAVLATAALASTAAAVAAEPGVDDLIAKIKDKDDKVRGPAWQGAAKFGAPAVKPLAKVMTDADFEVARASKRALWNIVRYAGRPGATDERAAVEKQLMACLTSSPTAVRRDILWMLSEIGTDVAVPLIEAFLADRELREDARAALERIPGEKSLAALQAGLEKVPEEFKPAIAQSLRVRGAKVTGYPSQKLVPTRPAMNAG